MPPNPPRPFGRVLAWPVPTLCWIALVLSSSTPLLRAEVQFSHLRGYYDSAFSLTLSGSAGEVRYTLDGTAPGPNAGLVYSQPIPITTTSVVRAVALSPEGVGTTVTQTYLFLNHIIHQGADQSSRGLPAFWVKRDGYTREADYAMDPRVLAAYPTLAQDLRTLPAVSIVMDPRDLFDQQTGIYSNSRSGGLVWERPASVEWIPPNGGPEFMVNAGIRISGELSSHENVNKKHGLRLLFKSVYGPSKLEFPLFPESPVQRYDTVVLRSHWGMSWLRYNNNNSNALYLRDLLMHDHFRATGHRGSHVRHVHLYLNGLYWGLYELAERPTETHQAEYVGGHKDDWDIIKGAIWLQYDGGVLDEGNRETWDHLFSYFPNSVSTVSNATYEAIQPYLDLENFIDYMLTNIWGNTFDWPQKNWYAASRRSSPGQPPLVPWRFFIWDAEYAMLFVGHNHTTIGDLANDDRGPGRLYRRLRGHPEFQMRFADRVQKHFFNDGAFTPENVRARFLMRAQAIDRAIVGESARWGDIARPEQPYTRDVEWVAERDNLLNNYLPHRTARVLSQLRAVSLYPSIDAPSLSHRGGLVDPGLQVHLDAPAGQILYTTDGTDPRLPGGAIAPSALTYRNEIETRMLVPSGSVWRYRDLRAPPPADWRSPDFSDADWPAGPARLGYGRGVEATVIQFGGNTQDRNPVAWFRHSFDFEDPAQVATLSLRLLRDDGAIVYLNEEEVVRSNMPAGDITDTTYAAGTVFGADENTFFHYTVPPSALRSGRNTLAVRVHQSTPTSSDLAFDLELVASLIDEAASIQIHGNTTLKTRALHGAVWSALEEAAFITEPDHGAIIISELHYHAADPSPSELAQIPGLTDADFDFLELHNRGKHAVDLSGYRIDDGIRFTFPPGSTITSGAYLVLASNTIAFRLRYGDEVVPLGQFGGNLSNSGETIRLLNSADEVLWSFTYSDRWERQTDGPGYSLVLRDLSIPLAALNSSSSWGVSEQIHGSPGRPNGFSGISFTGWLRRFFSEAERSNPALSGDLADPDGDGIPNLLEFVLGLNPRLADAPTRLWQLHHGASPSVIRATLTPWKDMLDYQLDIMTSADLQTWHVYRPEELGSGAPVDLEDGRERYEVEIPMQGDLPLFIRIGASARD